MTLAGDIIRGKALDLLVERAEIEPEAPKANRRTAEAEDRRRNDRRAETETSDDAEETP